VRATLPRDTAPETLSVDSAVALLAAKVAKGAKPAKEPAPKAAKPAKEPAPKAKRASKKAAERKAAE
jgi:DNA topoisomerase-1